MPTSRFTSACLIFAVSGLMLAGCEASVSTGGDEINTDTVETQIKSQYPPKADGLTLTAIDCEGGKAEVGTRFTCAASNDNAVDLDIGGEVTSIGKDDKVNIKWEVTKAVSAGATFGDVAAQTLARTRAVASVECPDGILIEAGTVVDCVGIMDNGTKREVKLTLTDGNGAFDIDLLGPTDG